MEVDELAEELKTHWQDMKEQLLAGGYRPQPVKRVEIPKPGGGGRRKLGIPTVIDRLIQQGLLQVLTPIFDPGFSEHSYGFRPGRSAQQAVLKSREYIEAGNRWVVDMDLWNAGAKHMNYAFPKRFFDQLGLHSFLDKHLAKQAIS